MFLNSKKILIYLPFFTKWVVPVLLVLAIVLLQLDASWVEKYYSTGPYLTLSSWFRYATGWLSISLGDCIYVIVGLCFLVKMLRLCIRIIRKENRFLQLGISCLSLLHSILWIYIAFNVLWGLNYSRMGIAHQLGLKKYEYSRQEVTLLTDELIEKVNAYRRAMKDSSLPTPTLSAIFTEAVTCYHTVSKDFNFLTYPHPSIKASLYSPLGSYFGFTGYYNPFSGEAQVRSDIPRVLIPYIACHEIAHQLGYASESEANFVGYLAASASTSIYFKYSVYLDLFDYAQREEIKRYILDKDTTGLKAILLQNRKNLDTLVINDRKKNKTILF